MISPTTPKDNQAAKKQPSSETSAFDSEKSNSKCLPKSVEKDESDFGKKTEKIAKRYNNNKEESSCQTKKSKEFQKHTFDNSPL